MPADPSKPIDLQWTHWVAPIHDLYPDPTNYAEFVIVGSTSFIYDYEIKILDIHHDTELKKSIDKTTTYYTKKKWLKEGIYCPIQVGSRWRHYLTGEEIIVTCIKNYPKIVVGNSLYSGTWASTISALQSYVIVKDNQCLQPSFL